MVNDDLIKLVTDCDKFRTELTHYVSLPIWFDDVKTIVQDYSDVVITSLNRFNYNNRYNEATSDSAMDKIYLPAIFSKIRDNFKLHGKTISIIKIKPYTDFKLVEKSLIMVEFIIRDEVVTKNVDRIYE